VLSLGCLPTADSVSSVRTARNPSKLKGLQNVQPVLLPGSVYALGFPIVSLSPEEMIAAGLPLGAGLRFPFRFQSWESSTHSLQFVIVSIAVDSNAIEFVPRGQITAGHGEPPPTASFIFMDLRSPPRGHLVGYLEDRTGSGK